MTHNSINKVRPFDAQGLCAESRKSWLFAACVVEKDLITCGIGERTVCAYVGGCAVLGVACRPCTARSLGASAGCLDAPASL